ncbi:MAG: class I SAM-dependent methyltransferase [Gammaproteobacteria bacterium]
MAAADKWDARYRDQGIDAPQPARVLRDMAHLLPASGRALDLACGLGANGLFMARRGLSVDAYDLSTVVVDKLNDLARRDNLSLAASCRDVEHTPPASESFDVVVVSYFLSRPLMRALTEALRPHGLLFYQTFIRDSIDVSGPANPAYRLDSNELLHAFAPLRILFYREEGRVGDVSRGFRNEAMLVGQKPAGEGAS